MMDRIILFGLSEEETDIIRGCGLKIELLPVEDYRDVLAYYAALFIINPLMLDEEGRNALTEFYREIDPCDEKVILTNSDISFKGISFVEVIEDFFDFPESIPIILMRNLKKTKRDVDFSRRIMLAIKIQKTIEDYPGITTKQIAELTEQSERSIKRYIRSLQAAGIMIEYRNKGWICIHDIREIL